MTVLHVHKGRVDSLDQKVIQELFVKTNDSQRKVFGSERIDFSSISLLGYLAVPNQQSCMIFVSLSCIPRTFQIFYL